MEAISRFALMLTWQRGGKHEEDARDRGKDERSGVDDGCTNIPSAMSAMTGIHQTHGGNGQA